MMERLLNYLRRQIFQPAFLISIPIHLAVPPVMESQTHLSQKLKLPILVLFLRVQLLRSMCQKHQHLLSHLLRTQFVLAPTWPSPMPHGLSKLFLLLEFVPTVPLFGASFLTLVLQFRPDKL